MVTVAILTILPLALRVLEAEAAAIPPPIFTKGGEDVDIHVARRA